MITMSEYLWKLVAETPQDENDYEREPEEKDDEEERKQEKGQEIEDL